MVNHFVHDYDSYIYNDYLVSLWSMSAILSLDDLNDFISPGVACIKPIETLPKQTPLDWNVGGPQCALLLDSNPVVHLMLTWSSHMRSLKKGNHLKNPRQPKSP